MVTIHIVDDGVRIGKRDDRQDRSKYLILHEGIFCINARYDGRINIEIRRIGAAPMNNFAACAIEHILDTLKMMRIHQPSKILFFRPVGIERRQCSLAFRNKFIMNRFVDGNVIGSKTYLSAANHLSPHGSSCCQLDISMLCYDSRAFATPEN